MGSSGGSSLQPQRVYSFLATLPQGAFFDRGYHNQTFLHPLAAVGVVVRVGHDTASAMRVLPRK